MNGNISNQGSQDLILELKVQYRVGHGGLWGSHDFWNGVLESITAGFIFLPFSILANLISNKIYEILKSSKSEKDEYQSCRFDLLILAKKKSWIIVRVMRSAKFKTKRNIEEKDISETILTAINRFNELSQESSCENFVVIAELTNHSDEIKISIHEKMDLDPDSLKNIKKQFRKLKSGKTIKLEIKK
ncbi:MAG: hypothetical protein A2W91_15140 [Bacteroidetes bacterium GWF2_38_335]|nr:MAG: hypothetical protein A2W91_15140 [Bacteroidetes bacterium GWF2_38_335]OFY81085.1 MAG: hypothetical protein A2281_13340 [Bacteroidetes bacterium RIFOXYA12_FULL_38_20]HBS87596.1 hypothetical protein [Bacteroidales bacterium]